MAVPKRKTSKSRAGKRRSHIKFSAKNIIEDKKRDDLLRDLLNYNDDINDLTKYFEKYRLFLLKTSLNLFTKGVIKSDF